MSRLRRWIVAVNDLLPCPEIAELLRIMLLPLPQAGIAGTRASAVKTTRSFSTKDQFTSGEEHQEGGLSLSQRFPKPFDCRERFRYSPASEFFPPGDSD